MGIWMLQHGDTLARCFAVAAVLTIYAACELKRRQGLVAHVRDPKVRVHRARARRCREGLWLDQFADRVSKGLNQ